MQPQFLTRPELRGTFGAVTSTHWLASAAGMRMLDLGGNAFDAAVATAFVLHVVEPHLNGPGGEFPALLHHGATGRTEVLCAQGVAPGAATIAHYRGLGLDLVPGDGLLATVVPGAFDGWMLMLRDHGSLSLRQVLEPAISYAANGHPLLKRISDTVAGKAGLFREHWRGSAAVWLPGDEVPRPHELFRNPELAACWTRLLAEAEAESPDRAGQCEAAREVFYRGFVAEAILGYLAEGPVMDETGCAHSGLLTAEDLAGWQASYEEPAFLDHAGWRVFKTGPWGQGPAFLEALAILEAAGIAGQDPAGPEFVHLVTEALKLALADRDAYFGEPRQAQVPLGALLEPGYIRARQADIDERASFDLRPGHLPGFEGQLEALAEALRGKLGGGAVYEPTMAHLARAEREGRGDTCHLDVVDRWGNVVSATPSGGWLQSSPVIPGLGFPLNSRAQMFWLVPGLPSSLAPYRRPRTTLTPGLARHEDGRVLAFGTPGGDQQDQWQLPFFLRVAHQGMGLQQALDAPQFHNMHAPSSFAPRTSLPGRLVAEASFPEATLEGLRARGHDLEVVPPHSLGRLTAALWEPGGVITGAAAASGAQAYAVVR